MNTKCNILNLFLFIQRYNEYKNINGKYAKGNKNNGLTKENNVETIANAKTNGR